MRLLVSASAALLLLTAELVSAVPFADAPQPITPPALVQPVHGNPPQASPPRPIHPNQGGRPPMSPQSPPTANPPFLDEYPPDQQTTLTIQGLQFIQAYVSQDRNTVIMQILISENLYTCMPQFGGTGTECQCYPVGKTLQPIKIIIQEFCTTSFVTIIEGQKVTIPITSCMPIQGGGHAGVTSQMQSCRCQEQSGEPCGPIRPGSSGPMPRKPSNGGRPPMVN